MVIVADKYTDLSQFSGVATGCEANSAHSITLPSTVAIAQNIFTSTQVGKNLVGFDG